MAEMALARATRCETQRARDNSVLRQAPAIM